MHLETIGWDSTLEQDLLNLADASLEPARVSREDRDRYLVLGERGELRAEVSGRFRQDVRDRTDFPTVGDWVAVRPRSGEARGTIHALLPRRSRFVRKAAGETSEDQVVAANVDVVFLMTGLDGNFRLRRIERYLTLARESGAEPVVVLGKADLTDDVDLRVRQAEGVAPGVAVLAVSALLGTGIDAVQAFLGLGRTGALLGSSGVGKSTLVNQLLGEERLVTQSVRADDDRGRHTTTWRELVVLPDGGGIVIDTPGMREIQLRGDGLAGSFSEVEALAGSCRFRDCGHEEEPGCAVQKALGDGSLDVDRYESYLEQRRELAYQQRRQDVRLRQAEEDRWRQITIAYRKKKKHRDRHDPS